MRHCPVGARVFTVKKTLRFILNMNERHMIQNNSLKDYSDFGLEQLSENVTMIAIFR